MTMLRSVYIESQDNLVIGCEDGTIYVWGYDDAAKEALRGMAKAATDPALIRRYGSLLDSTSDLLSDNPRGDKQVQSHTHAHTHTYTRLHTHTHTHICVFTFADFSCCRTL